MSAESDAMFAKVGAAIAAHPWFRQNEVTIIRPDPWPKGATTSDPSGETRALEVPEETRREFGRAALKALILAVAPEAERTPNPRRICEDHCPLFRYHCVHSRECVVDLGERRDPCSGVGVIPGEDCPMREAKP